MKKIVKASAGTGKTYRLAIEYVARLLLGEEYGEILFMTFTRAATAELKGRVFEFLKKIEEDENSQEAMSIKENYPKVEVDSKKIAKLRRELLLNKDKMRIFTIDSFTSMVFKKAIAPYLNIYAYASALDSDEEKTYNSVFNRLVDGEDFERVRKFLEKTADRDVNKYLDLIKTVSRERWKFSLIDSSKDKQVEDISGLRDDLYRNIIEIQLCLKELIEEHGKVEEKLVSKNSATRKIIDRFGWQWAPSKEIVDYVLSDIPRFMEKYYNGTQTRAKGVAHIKERLEEYQGEIHRILDRFIFINEVLPYERDIIEIESIVRSIYDDIKFREKSLSFADITNYTSEYIYKEELDLISDGLVTENFYDLIGGKITTLFLDEAQDTSVSQWKIIEPIALGAKNVIIVGDEKQSIYSWRGGEKSLFTAMKTIINGEEETLPRSYRSHSKVIGFVNHFFKAISAENDGWEYKEVECAKEKEEKGYIEVIADKDIVDRIVEDIEYKFGDTKDYRGIGIIARKTSTLDEIGLRLKEKGIPYITQNSLSIVHHLCIKEIIRILRYVESGDYLALIEFMRGDSIGIDDEQMKKLLIHRDKIEEFLIEGVEIVVTQLGIHSSVEDILLRVREIVVSSYSNLGKKIVENFNYYNIYSSPRDIKNINFFLELMDESMELREFMEFLRGNENSESLKQVGISELNSIQLMSIHKSKGLEFHTEYMHIEDKRSSMKLGGYENGISTHKLNLMTKLDDRYERVEEYLFTNSKYKKHIEETSIYKYSEEVYDDEYLNVLYVGMTRPKANLIICIKATVTTKNKEEVVKLTNDMLINPLKSYFNLSSIEDEEPLLDSRVISKGAFLPYEDEKSDNTPKWHIEDINYYKDIYNERNNIKKDILGRKERSSHTYEVSIELKRKVGLAIHFMLENLVDLSETSIEIAKNQMIAKYGNMLGTARIEEILERIDRFLEKRRDIFDPKYDVYRELSLRSKEKIDGTATHKIDRVNVDHSNGEIFIYDYKTGITKEESQLDRYKEVVEEYLKEMSGRENYRVVHTEFLNVEKI